jgi:protein phosphatase
MSKIVISAASDTGTVRANNEDCLLVAGMVERDGPIHLEISTDSLFFTRYGLLCAVADGMGAHAGGEFASRYVMERLVRDALHIPLASGEETARAFLRNTILAVHKELNDQGELNPSLAGMGSTLTGVLLSPAHNFFFHVGDSRLYRFREGLLQRVTRDHSPNELLAEDESAQRKTGGLVNSVGGGAGFDCRPEIENGLSFVAGDTLMLCSDGLSDAGGRDPLRDVLRRNNTLAEKVRGLITAARESGATDNITVVVIEYREDPVHGR